MPGFLIVGQRRIDKRQVALWIALAATVATTIATVAGPVSSASADPPWRFCENVWLQPMTFPGEQCHMPVSLAGDHLYIGVITYTRAGCVALLGYYGEQLDSWVCGGATGGLKAAEYWLPAGKPFGYYRAAIRNNNKSYGATFAGYYYCCR